MITHPALFSDDATVGSTTASRSRQSATRGLWSRLAVWYAAKVQAERDAEIVAFIAERGGNFSDEMEREISRRFGSISG
jgi:hypothetical protein